jgi:hypothetical protein
MIQEEDLKKLCDYAKELNGGEALNLDVIEDIANALSIASGETIIPELMLIPVDIVKSYKDYADYVEVQLKENNYPVVFEEWYSWMDDEE